MTGGPEPLSAVAREALERELADLRTEREAVAVTLRDGGGDEVGDRADQADELQRADELDRLAGRITEIEGRLREGAVAGAPSTDAVRVGSSVTVRFADGTESTVQIGELANALDATLVTADSPLGKALLGHRAGDTVTYDTPEGRATAVVVSLG
ncbi:GreA/GreB family elongation factor [Streptomyces vietnamensis]|uniref:Nucleoside diphosphate kinase regulator n=1 Tax=Streptomyces vietnamensis TaxID=362257 RepID=A0A0B5ICS6_9ACTN|nr:GreA/GreB family elongation factor [Streptomyces vietnamensis]AJF68287.1 nucleoside diphosphate kinase regulator [Streptomyces vietnamensis]